MPNPQVRRSMKNPIKSVTCSTDFCISEWLEWRVHSNQFCTFLCSVLLPNCFQLQFDQRQSCQDVTVDQQVLHEHCSLYLVPCPEEWHVTRTFYPLLHHNTHRCAQDASLSLNGMYLSVRCHVHQKSISRILLQSGCRTGHLAHEPVELSSWSTPWFSSINFRVPCSCLWLHLQAPQSLPSASRK